MARAHLLLSALVIVAGCNGTNPFFPPEDAGPPDVSDDSMYAADLNDSLQMNALSYDSGADTLTINNLPFDGPDGTYQAKATNLAGPFAVYESIEGSETGKRQYYAVFRKSTYVQAAAVGTNDYANFGFGGATAQRFGNTLVTLPTEGEYTFTGEYAGVRILRPQSGTGTFQFVEGNVEVVVDILDFDVTGAVEAIISDRMLYDIDGNQIGPLIGSVALGTAEIDFTNSLVLTSTAYGYEIKDAGMTQLQQGYWKAMFGGPNGEEIAGIVLLEGTTPVGDDDVPVRETGVFIAVRP